MPLCSSRAFSKSRGRGKQDEGGEEVGVVAPAGGSEVGVAGGAQQADDEIVEGGHHAAGVAAGEAGGVLLEGGIATVVQAILDPPIRAGEREQVRRRGLS